LAHDVFISYTTADKAAADAVCHRLEEAGIRCWIAPRDVGFGDWGASIVEAIGAAKLVVMILSAAANASPNVLDEVVTALDAGATVIPFRIEDIRPTGALRLRLGRLHWLDALSSPLDQHIDRLIEIAKRILPAAEAEGEAAPSRQEEQARQPVEEPLPLLHVAEESHLRAASPEPQRATEPTKLEQAGESLAAAPPPPLQPPSPVSPPAPKLINRAVAAGALAVLVLGGGAALLFFSKNEISPTPSRPRIEIDNPNYTGINPPLPVNLGDTYDKVKAIYQTSQTPERVPDTDSGIFDRLNGVKVRTTKLLLREVGIAFFFDSSRKIVSIGLYASFAGSVAGVSVGDTKTKVDGIWGEPTQNFNNFMVYYSYRGKIFEIIYSTVGDLKVETIYVDS
jgi:TIR domain